MANMMDYSPALSATSEMTDEELDRYFASYVPLSNLPTPPPAKEEHAIPRCAPQKSCSQTPSPTLSTFTSPSSQDDLYAAHLANLVPLNVSSHRPHPAIISSFLARANLPDEIVAFSACILDSLSSRFASTWRDALAPSDYARDLQNFLRTDSLRTQQLHVSPDVIVLAALALAHGWLVDRTRSSRHWSAKESAGVFSVGEIEATMRAVLSDMEYGLFRIKEDVVERRLRNMQRKTTVAEAVVEPAAKSLKASRPRNLSLSLAGTSLWRHGVQTPEPSP
ncbi:hypothetical protein NX059_002804 [Plenodomus lindquistii]|nr:hypothetical protein NX059_002804 [Plenodomus lindquistii]